MIKDFLDRNILWIDALIFLIILIILYYINGLGITAADTKMTFIEYNESVGSAKYIIPTIAGAGIILNLIVYLKKPQ